MDTRVTLGLVIAVLAISCSTMESMKTMEEKIDFERLADSDWQEVFYDSFHKDWKEKWTLDGMKATIRNTEKGMDFCAGPTAWDDSCHAVLWTKESFQGDIKVDYEYTRLDNEIKFVTILYLQATGSGEGPYTKDISKWANLRTIPAMRIYYDNMNTYHISYAAFDVDNEDPHKDYIRARRYLPETKSELDGTDLSPDYFETGLFKTGVPHKITIIKKGNDLYMRIENNEKQMLCHWRNRSLRPIHEGRIGLRHMYTRGARYRDFRVSELK